MYATRPLVRDVTIPERSSLAGLTDTQLGMPEWFWLALLVGGGYVAYRVAKKGVGLALPF